MFDQLKEKYKLLKNHTLNDLAGINVNGILLSKNSNNTFEVVYCNSVRKPQTSNLRSLWKTRRQGTAVPLIVACEYENKFSVCGPVGDEPPVHENIEKNIALIICSEALDKESYPLALRSVKDNLVTIEDKTIGLKNEGLFANHVLSESYKNNQDWGKYKEKSLKVVGKKDKELLKALGYELTPLDSLTHILKAEGKKKALGVLLRPNEMVDLQSARFGGLTPISHAFNLADRENLPFVIVSSASSIRLYSTEIGLGVGRKGRTETFVHCQTNLLGEKEIGNLWLIFAAEALNKKGTFYQLIEDSTRFSGSLADKLRERIYIEVVPLLANGIFEELFKGKIKRDSLNKIYEMSMLVLFRILFIAYAEDKDLLPYKSNDLYKKRSLKNIALELKDLIEKKEISKLGNSKVYWDYLKHIFSAINFGNKQWNIPTYNGGLFSEDNSLLYAYELNKLSIKDKYVGKALSILLLDDPKKDGVFGPVDFRSLGVREFGSIYEGLLEGSLNYADENLEVLPNKTVKPTTEKSKANLIYRGTLYLSNKSGKRKATGTYYTKSFIVDYLLQNSLYPALDNHLSQLDKLNDEEAGEKFFDFKITDISMGSGHFLITAIDFMEVKFSNYLSKRKIPGVISELLELRNNIKFNLGDASEITEIEDSQLLRRLIARRCIYGVDINPVAAQLARLAVWIHTFVPGLPLSFLDHNLVEGNSLIGIGKLDEIRDYFIEEQKNLGDLFKQDPVHLLESAIEPLKKLSKLSDSNIKVIKKAHQIHKEASESIKHVSVLCDIITASKAKNEKLSVDLGRLKEDLGTILGSSLHKKYQAEIDSLCPFHFPIAFPEIFLRENPGFDVVFGNPPWEEIMLDEDEYWGRYLPGFHGLRLKDRQVLLKKIKKNRPDLVDDHIKSKKKIDIFRDAICSGDFPGIETGHPDMYKAFSWRFWKLLRNEGHIGVITPRNLFLAKGSKPFREELINNSNQKVIFLLNNKKWVFDDVHPQYSFALVNIQKKLNNLKNYISLAGPFLSYKEFKSKSKVNLKKINSKNALTWNKTISFPLLISDISIEIFEKMRKHPDLYSTKYNDWLCHTIQGDINATFGRAFFNSEITKKNKNYWPVYAGESFDIWNPDTKKYYTYANKDKLIEHLQKQRKRSYNRTNSIYSNFDKKIIDNFKTLPCFDTRIAFRDITNRTNKRTVIVSLVPSGVFLANQAPFLLWSKGNEQDQAYLLGVMSSKIFDWYARRFVELHLNFYLLNNFPIPRLNKKDPIRKRIIELSAKLAFVDQRYSNWFHKIGIKFNEIKDNQKQDYIVELDALVAMAYGLERKDINEIFETFHKSWKFEDELKETISIFEKLKK